MKTHLPTLLIFFLLLVDKPVSPLPTSLVRPLLQLGKEGLKVLGGIAFEKAWDKNHQNNPPPSPSPPSPHTQQQQSPPPPTQPQVIEGLSSVKSYLYNYGYIRSQTYPPSFTDTLDDDIKSALINYQSAFKLQTTGLPDPATIDKMLQPRCSVPDLGLRYILVDNINQQLSWPKGTNWSPNPNTLTYGFDSSVTSAGVYEFRRLFQSWSRATGVSLTEMENVQDAQIKVMFYDYFNSGQIRRMEVAGSTIIQRGPPSSISGNNNNNNAGFIILENRKRWVLPGYSQEVGMNSLNVVMHQIGHILGLEHSHDEESIMHPVFNYPPQQTKEISDSDMKQISRLSSGQPAAGGGILISDKYQPAGGGSGGNGSGGNGSGGNVSSGCGGSGGSDGSSGSSSGGGRVGFSWGLLIATLSIGFSCMAHYY